MTGTTVRRATPADAPILAGLLWDFNTEFETPVDPFDVLARRFARLLATDGIDALLAGDRLGFALVTLRPAIWYDGPAAQLEELYVVPHLRDQGIGSALLAAARDVAREQGSPELHINVDEDDADTVRFYERHGFSCRTDGNPGDRRDTAYRMLCFIGSTSDDR